MVMIVDHLIDDEEDCDGGEQDHSRLALPGCKEDSEANKQDTNEGKEAEVYILCIINPQTSCYSAVKEHKPNKRKTSLHTGFTMNIHPCGTSRQGTMMGARARWTGWGGGEGM